MMETNYHIFQCAHRIPIFLHRHEEFTEYLMSLQTPNTIISALAGGMLSWNINTQQPRQEHIPDINLQACLHEQAHIGWNLAHFGILTTAWGDNVHAINPTIEPTSWHRKVSTWLTNNAYKTWLTRNSERYPKTITDTVSAAEREMDAQLTKVYDLADQLITPFDRRELLPQPIEERRLLPAKRKGEWIKQMTYMICTRHKNNKTRPNLTDIRAFFQPVNYDQQNPDAQNIIIPNSREL